jgi:hypothetical protein
LPDAVTQRATRHLAVLEQRANYAVNGGRSTAGVEQLALPIDGIGNVTLSIQSLLRELKALDTSQLTPLEALNRLAAFQERAGGW